MNKRNTLMLAIRLICVCLGAILALSAADKQLEEALKQKYDLTKIGIDRLRITKPGVVLVLQQGGILAKPSTDYGNITTKVEDGKVIQPKGLGAFFANGDQTAHALKAGDKVYVTR